MKTYYTLGFLFNFDWSRIALIRKTKPDWQRGKLNGIGGHVEENENPDECMRREFKEEVECSEIINWTGFALLKGNDFEVFCYYGECSRTGIVESKTDEVVEIILVNDSPNKRNEMVENLHWLIELALDSMKDGRPFYSYIDYEHPHALKQTIGEE